MGEHHASWCMTHRTHGVFCNCAELEDPSLEIEQPQAELAALREYMAQHAPMELRGFDIRGAEPENPEKWK